MKKHYLSLLLMGLTVTLAQENPRIFERTFFYDNEGKEYVYQDYYLNLSPSLKTLSSERITYSQIEGKSEVRIREKEYFFEDSIVSRSIFYYPSEFDPRQGDVAIGKQTRVRIPSKQTNVSRDTTWIYGENFEHELFSVSVSENRPNYWYAETWRFDNTTGTWFIDDQRRSETKFDYDDNGCITRRRFLWNGQVNSQSHYIRNADCEIQEERRAFFDPRTQSWTGDTLVYRREANLLIVEDKSGGFYKEITDLETGRILLSQNESNGSFSIQELRYEQKEDTLITYSTRRTKYLENEWINREESAQKVVEGRYQEWAFYYDWSEKWGTWNYKNISSSTFNETGDIIQNNFEGFAFDTVQAKLTRTSNRTVDFEYRPTPYCDGLLKERLSLSNGQFQLVFNPTQRVEYGYYYPTDCFSGRNTIKSFPNPIQNGEMLSLSGDALQQKLELRLIDLMGRVVKEMDLSPRLPEIRLRIDGLKPGTYLFQVLGDDGWEATIHDKLVVY